MKTGRQVYLRRCKGEEQRRSAPDSRYLWITGSGHSWSTRKDIVLFLKICGIQNTEEANAAINAGATAIGMLVGLTHRAQDKIDEVRAREIALSLPNWVESVMVTHLLDVAAIAELVTFIGVRAVQVHDDLPPDCMSSLAALLPEVRLIKAVHVTGDDAVEHALSYASVSDALLLDSRTDDRLGGTGLTHDWTISRRIVEAVAPLSTYLAGGLRCENIEDAVRIVGPAGVDVNSGVEDSRGAKDVSRMHAFLSKAATALAAVAVDGGHGRPRH